MKSSIVTYNIHKGIGNDRLYRLNRTIDVLKNLEADFYFLQEVDQFVPRSRKEDLAQVIAEELGMHHALGLNVKLKKGAYGNAVLSRYPILESTNINLTWGIKKKRGCLYVKTKTPSGTVSLMNFHLGLAGMERTWQIKKLIEYINQNKITTPLIVAGDSNDRKHKLNRFFSEIGLTDSFSGSKNNTYPAYAPIWRLDKTFLSSDIEMTGHHVIKNKQTRMTSDHLPIKVEFSITGGRKRL